MGQLKIKRHAVIKNNGANKVINTTEITSLLLIPRKKLAIINNTKVVITERMSETPKSSKR